MTTTLLSNVDPNSLSRLTKTGTSQQRAEKVIGQFEGMLVREILKSAKPPSMLPTKSGEAKLVGEVYGDMAHDMVANQISQSGQLGMTTALSRQLALQIGAESHPEKALQPPQP
jgi:Rod binding domain-containing protein